jgi:predicted lipase
MTGIELRRLNPELLAFAREVGIDLEAASAGRLDAADVAAIQKKLPDLARLEDPDKRAAYQYAAQKLIEVARSTSPQAADDQQRVFAVLAERLQLRRPADIDADAAKDLLARPSAAHLSAAEKARLIGALLHEPATRGSELQHRYRRAGEAETERLVVSLFTDDRAGLELGAAIASRGLAFELIRQLDQIDWAEHPALVKQLSGAVSRQLGSTRGIADEDIVPAAALLPPPTLRQLAAVIDNPTLMRAANPVDRYDLFTALLEVDLVGPRAALIERLFASVPEEQKQQLSIYFSKWFESVPDWRSEVGSERAVAAIERAVQVHVARHARQRDFGLMRDGLASLRQNGGPFDLPKVAAGPQRLMAAEAANRATQYARELSSEYEGLSYKPGVVRGENIGTMAIRLHVAGGKIIELGRIDMNDPLSYSVEGVMAQMSQLVNDHHYRGTSVARSRNKPMPFVNGAPIDPSAWRFRTKAEVLDGDFAGMREYGSLPRAALGQLLAHAGLLGAGESLPHEPEAAVRFVREKLATLGATERDFRIAGQPDTSTLRVLEDGRIEMDTRMLEVLVRRPQVNRVAPAKLFQMHAGDDARWPELRPGAGHDFVRIVDGNPRFVMPASAFTQYVGGGLLRMERDPELAASPSNEKIRDQLEATLRHTYDVIPDVRLLADGQIAIPLEHWSLLHRALGFDVDMGATEHSFLNQERTAWMATVAYEDLRGAPFTEMMQSKGFFHRVELDVSGTARVSATAALPTSFTAAQRAPRNSGFVTIEKDGAEVWVASNEQGVFVAVRGTAGAGDIVTDADAAVLGDRPGFSGWKDAQAHPGFFSQNVAVRDEVARAIKWFDPDGKKKLVMAGHSKGGAEAVGLAAMLHVGWPGQAPVATAQAVYTYGGARYFNKEGAQAYNDSPLGPRTYAIQNHIETVPRVPTRGMGYRHAGTIFRFEPHSYEVYEFGKEPKDSAWEIVKSAAHGLITGHFMSKYIALGRGKTAVSSPALPGEYPRDTSTGPKSGRSL